MGRISTKFKPQLYTAFAGINTSRSDVSMERPEAQPFSEIENLYCSSKGYLSNESSLTKYGTDNAYISHIRYFSSDADTAVYAARVAGGTSLRVMNRNAAVEKVWPRDANVCTTLFNAKVILAAGQDTMYSFDGLEFTKIDSPTIKGARYICQIQDRLAIAGFDSNPNEIVLSRVNNERIYKNEEDQSDVSVLKSARFNVQNLIGNGDRIRGITSFESNKFAIFTNDRVLVYLADQDFSNWALDTRLVVRYGTVSHNSIVPVGDEVFFCSRAGIHSLRRSALNGATVYTTPLSEDIQELYQSLLAQVPDKSKINAHFNPDEGRLHIFFPVNDLVSYRLSGALSAIMQEGGSTTIKWSLSKFAGLTCGDYIAGRHLCGSVSGLYKVGVWYSNDAPRGDGYAVTPILWHKDLFNPKQGLALVLYASGAGKVLIDAEDETQRSLGTYEFELPDTDQADYAGVPLQRQFIRPFTHEYIGLRLRLRFEATKMIRVFGLGVLTKEP